MSNDWVGRTLGKVHVESLLARGGVGEVYLGTHKTLGRKVAVKILRNPGEEDSDALERFQREARVVASLRHHNIVQVYDFDMIDNDPYLVMEYIKGPSLSKYLYFLFQRNERLELPQVVHLLNGVASALDYAHKNNIIHRDIKPGNILLTTTTGQIDVDKPLPDDFEPVLTDFGLVRFLDSARHTKSGVTAGTPAYMSPEQALGETTDGRTDIYSLGIVLYEILAGRLPFDGESTVSLLLKHVNEPPEPISGLSQFMQKVLDRALAKDPNKRFQTPLEFARAFHAAVDINPDTKHMEALASLDAYTGEKENLPATKISTKQNQPKRSNWIRLVIGGIIVIALAALIFVNGFPFLAPPTITSTSTPTYSAIPPSPTSTSTLTPIPTMLGSTGVLRFQNANAIADQVELNAHLMPAPPDGNQYEVWLFNTKKRISLGILSLDETGSGELVYTDENGANLIALYDGMEITVEPNPDTSSSPTKLIAYAFTLPADGVIHIRNLLSSFENAPEKTSLTQGFYASMEILNGLADDMQTTYESGDEIQARRDVEAILNLIVGKQSPDYKDWDQDGFIADDSDGYGLLLNGSSFGYLQGIYEEADFTTNVPGASLPMINFGGYVKTSVQNISALMPELKELLIKTIDTPAGSDLSKQISEIARLAELMFNGIDVNSNGVIEPLPGEGGALTTYEQTYYVADMPLLRVGVFGNFTPTATISVGGGGSGGSGGGGGGSGGGVTNPPPAPTKPKGKPPTNTPKK